MSIFLLSFDDKRLTQAQVAEIKEHVPSGLDFVHTDDKNAIKEMASEIEVIAGEVRPKGLLDMPNLKWAQQWGAGANWLMRYPELVKRPFTLTNVAGIHAIPISEHILGMLLHFGRNFANAVAAQKEHTWANIKRPTDSYEHIPFAFSTKNLFELADKTMLVIGVGAIGERTAKLAKAFDMHVIGIRHNPDKASPYVDQMVSSAQLLDVLPLADFVVLTAPLTKATRHMIGEQAFAAMKASAFLSNIGRGELVDETYLLPALQNETIAGAALDVFEQEPLPQDSPFWALDNLFITSHYSGANPRYNERALTILLDNMARYGQQQPLRNVVDKEL
ncbi:MAG: D-2-hydroxyacid dehydrogenase, partial [Chloroflexi bacterium]